MYERYMAYDNLNINLSRCILDINYYCIYFISIIKEYYSYKYIDFNKSETTFSISNYQHTNQHIHQRSTF